MGRPVQETKEKIVWLGLGIWIYSAVVLPFGWYQYHKGVYDALI